MGRFQKLKTSIAFNIIGAVVLLLALSGVVVSSIGLISFNQTIMKEYTTTTFHMADATASLVNGDQLDDYLYGEKQLEYQRSKRALDLACQKLHVSLIYVIQVDQTDFGRFVSVFNSVNNAVDNSSYTEWPIGYKRNATNEEYSRKYRALYEKTADFETIFRDRPTDGSHPHITTMVPIRYSSGNVAGILCVQRPINEIEAMKRPYLVSIAVFTVLLSIVVALLAAFYIKKNFVAPIRRVSDEAVRFAKENTKGQPLGNISSLKEFYDLARSIDTMETDMVNYIQNLTAATAEKERMGTELMLASRIQEASIPNVFPAFPGRQDFDIFASMTPAREVGGDFYNFFLVDNDHLAVIIGDVSGKGIPAALFMMVTNILLSDRTQMGGSPAEILTYVNNEICSHNQADMFVTIWLGILELSTGKLTAVNAGHEYPALRKANGQFELYKDKHGFVVGGMKGYNYKAYQLQLEPGDRLFVYTDGVAEATDADNALFGTRRMIDALNEDPAASPEQVLRHVRGAVDRFVKDAEQFDDLTMLCLEYKGSRPIPTGEDD